MFGLFKSKSFESEMAEFDKMAKKSGERFSQQYSPAKMMSMDPMQEMSIWQAMVEEGKKVNILRIDCCRRYSKHNELKHWMDINNSM